MKVSHLREDRNEKQIEDATPKEFLLLKEAMKNNKNTGMEFEYLLVLSK